jgi:hypothetical protein
MAQALVEAHADCRAYGARDHISNQEAKRAGARLASFTVSILGEFNANRDI